MKCEKPSILNGSVSPPNDTLNYGDTYEVICDPGYGIHGPSTVTCGLFGNLDQTPTCEGPCDKPAISNGSVANPTDASVAYGEAYEVTCDPGYYMPGTRTMTCTTGGNFDQTPTCGKDFHKQHS